MTAKKRKTAKRKVVQKSARQIEVQLALQHTWLLKGQLKTIQMSYLRIGAMLVKAREDKMFATLGHADIEDYAEKRLNLGQSSLYQYIRVYDWAKAKHPEWLEKHPKGFIPELSDVADLMWVEEKLANPNLAGDTRSKLQALQAKALEGKLRQRDLREFRVKSKAGTDPMKALLSSLFTLRRRCLRLKDIPPEAISKLEGVIEVVQNAQAVRKAGETLAGAA
jgi:hypothetical protein